MIEKMKCIVVDDDRLSVEFIKDICKNSEIAEISQTYHSPIKFMDTLSKIDFDLCLINFVIPGMDRVSLLQKLTGRNFIFITNVDEKLKEAMNLVEPIDVIPKPIRKERLNKGLEMAHRIIGSAKPRKEFELFNIAEGNLLSID